MKATFVLSILLFIIVLFAACRAPLPAISTSDIATETIVPAQATPTPTPTATPPKLTREQMQPRPDELQKMAKSLQDTYKPPTKIFEREVIYETSGPTTKGMTITIAGKKIKLPDDTYIEHNVYDITASPGKNAPETPYFVIARGNSRILVPKRSGKIYSETIAPGEEGAFNFLKEALK